MEKQTKAIYRKEDGGNEWRNLNENKYEIPVLSEEEIKELTDIIVKIENHFNFPCDVEWAKEGDKFYIIQSRPITTLSDDIFTRKFKKFFTRELSLIFIEYWHKGEYTELQKLLDGATHFNPLFIRRNGLVDVYYDMNNVDTALQPLFDFFKDNPKKFDEFVIKFNSLQNEMHLMVTDFKFELFEKLFITICKAWGYLPVWVQLGSSSEKYFPRHYIEKSLELRDKFQEIEYTVGEVLKGAIEKKYPELSNYSDVISFKEVIDNKFPDRQELEVRKGEFVYFEGKVLTNTSVQEFGKEYNVEFDESLSTIGEIPKTSSVKTIDSSLIKGQTAYSNGSIIKGVVGEDVLVTHMTRPDMIDKIKKSRAVITDEGGILSHAAITCRELKIPCIIGTKHATKLLKQGDMVEINTEEGVVKLVKDTV